MNVHAAALAQTHQFDEQTSAFAGDVIGDLVAISEAAVAEIFLRRRGLGAVRADHGAAGILSDPHRARHPARAAATRSLPSFPKGAALVEFGAGATTKVRLLLERCDFGAYVPVDISGDFLQRAGRARLRQDFPELGVYPVAADFTAPFALPAEIAGMPKVGFFPGSTLGNFEPHEARAFLRSARDILGEGAQMIIGVDLEKDERVLYDAYNDAAGVTARFNLNVLVRINRELGGNFDVSAFMHRSIYNRERHRIEMHLISHEGAERAHPRPEFLIPSRRKHPHRDRATNTASTASPRWRADSGWSVRESWTDSDADVFGSRAGGVRLRSGWSPSFAARRPCRPIRSCSPTFLRSGRIRARRSDPAARQMIQSIGQPRLHPATTRE